MIELVDVKVPEPAGGQAPWQDPQWLAAADAWITERCADAGLARTGPAQARCRMYSVVARVPVAGGRQVWFKANPPAAAFEPALGRALSVWSPRDAPPILAVDIDAEAHDGAVDGRAWALTRDVGVRLDSVFAADPDITHWHTPIRRYARLQILLAGRHADLLALGVPDLRPEKVADTAEALFADPALADTVDTPDGPSAVAFAAARERVAVLRGQWDRLAALGVPASLDHGDLHPGNILGSGSDARPFDWGDAVLGHPFASLLIVLRSAPEDGGVRAGGPELDVLRETYLGPWIEHGLDPVVARQAVDLALSTGAVTRALAWRRVFPCFSGSLYPRANSARWLAWLADADPLAD